MIAASRCPACRRVACPPEERCLACRAGSEETELVPEGTVLTYTQLADAWIALVELEGGARLLARAEREPAIGEEYRLSVEDEGYRLAP